MRCIMTLLVMMGSVSLAQADWPLFRGNAEQTGIAAGSTLPDPLVIRWKIKLKDSVEGTAAIVGDTVYVGSLDEHLYALNLADGKEKWKYKAGPIKAPPSVKDGAVYVGDEEGMFHCVDAKTGGKRWTFETGGEITSGANFAGDHILFGGWDSTLYCLTKDGKLAWKFKTEGPVNGAPAIAGNRTFVAGCDSHLHVIDIKAGKELAKIDLGGQAGATAAIAGNMLYVGTMSNQVLAVDLKKNDIAWAFEPQRSQPFYGSAAVTDKLVIVGCRNKLLHALERTKGTEVWKFPTMGRVDSSPVVVGKRVFVGSTDGNLYVIDLDKGRELKRFGLGRSITASPAVAHNCLVIGTSNGFVVCLGKKD
jgi:outer membrane protein assembly factor BamB